MLPELRVRLAIRDRRDDWLLVPSWGKVSQAMPINAPGLAGAPGPQGAAGETEVQLVLRTCWSSRPSQGPVGKRVLLWLRGKGLGIILNQLLQARTASFWSSTSVRGDQTHTPTAELPGVETLMANILRGQFHKLISLGFEQAATTSISLMGSIALKPPVIGDSYTDKNNRKWYCRLQLLQAARSRDDYGSCLSGTIGAVYSTNTNASGYWGNFAINGASDIQSTCIGWWA